MKAIRLTLLRQLQCVEVMHALVLISFKVAFFQQCSWSREATSMVTGNEGVEEKEVMGVKGEQINAQ